ncbi:MAG: MraY family glycosyltransferase [Bacteroidia bacterium]|nr:MraY family glycosyltransferase [Bacteroidia bacterium]
MKSVLLLLGASFFSWMLNKILLRFSKNFGVESRKEQTGLVRWASTSKPTTGGISFYITFLIGSLILLIMNSGVTTENGNVFLALFLSATMAFMVGFADDAYGTHPLLKFLGQVACGGILIAFGLHIQFFQLWSPQLVLLDYALTIFWVVGMMNSLNMLDNMDGVTATIATSILMTTMWVLIAREGVSTLFMVMTTIIGGFVGFLFWNWRPAKVYMGDTGSMFIGLVLAFAGMQYFWNIKTSVDNISHIRTILIPVMVFIVPIMDTTFVTVARIARGSSPFVGGKDHLTHNLVRVGVPEHLVPVLLGMVSIVSGLLAIFVCNLIPEWRNLYSLMFAIYPVTVFTLFTTLYIRGTRIGHMRDMLEKRGAQVREHQNTAPQPVSLPASQNN